MGILNFCGDLFLRKILPHEYHENKSLAKLNLFPVCEKGTYRIGKQQSLRGASVSTQSCQSLCCLFTQYKKLAIGEASDK